jgi:hypothetical protein
MPTVDAYVRVCVGLYGYASERCIYEVQNKPIHPSQTSAAPSCTRCTHRITSVMHTINEELDDLFHIILLQ